MTTSDLFAMSRHEFVSLTTFRRDGSPIATPMWVAADGDALVFTTPAVSGKVKRLRRDPRVELRPCSRGGRVADDAPSATGVAGVTTAHRSADRALRDKYGWQYRAIMRIERILSRRSRERVILRVGSG